MPAHKKVRFTSPEAGVKTRRRSLRRASTTPQKVSSKPLPDIETPPESPDSPGESWGLHGANPTMIKLCLILADLIKEANETTKNLERAVFELDALTVDFQSKSVQSKRESTSQNRPQKRTVEEECPWDLFISPSRMRPRQRQTCRKCGNSGHNARTCPRPRLFIDPWEDINRFKP